MHFEDIANIAAMIFSFIAMIILLQASGRMGGALGKTMKIMTAGIFMAVFCHAGFEMFAVMVNVDEAVLFPVMGVLLSVGSLAFAWAGRVALSSID